MPTLRLGTYEVRKYGLPPTCARCGAKAVVSPPKRFAWSPSWLPMLILLGAPGLLIYLVLAASLARYRIVPLPLCERHRNYWLTRKLFFWSGLAALVLFGPLAITLAVISDDRGLTDDLIPFAILGTIGAALVWLITAAIVQSVSIRATEITEHAIALTGLSPEFVEAVRDARSGDEEEDAEDEEDEPPRPRRRDREYDGGYYDRDEGEPRRGPPPDAIEEGDKR
jgi:hypothetical protein